MDSGLDKLLVQAWTPPLDCLLAGCNMSVESDNTQVVAGRKPVVVGRRHAAAAAAAAVAAASNATAAAAVAAAAAAADFGYVVVVVSLGQMAVLPVHTHWAFRAVRWVLSTDQRMTEPMGWKKLMAYWHRNWSQNLSGPFHDPKRAEVLAAH